MKNRVLAAVLAACLLAAPLGVAVPAQAAVNASDARAYLDILNGPKIGDRLDGYLVDFDGDGRDELVTLDTGFGSDYAIGRYAVYQGGVTLMENGEVSYDDSLSIYTRDGKNYLCPDYGYNGSYKVFYTLEQGNWVEVESCGSSPMYGDGDFTGEIGYYVNNIQVSKAEHDAVQGKYTFQYTLIDCNSTREGNIRPQLEAALYAEMTPEELLGQMAYVGDRGKCRMTAEQATAYADDLEKQLAKEDENWRGHSYKYKADAVLFNTGSGVPAMALAAAPSGEWCQPVVWEYLNGEITRTIDEQWGCYGIDIFEDHLFYSNRGAIGESDTALAFQNGYINRSPVAESGPVMDENGYNLYQSYTGLDGATATGAEIQAWYDKWDGNHYLCRLDPAGYKDGSKGAQDAYTLLTLLRAYATANLAPTYPLFTDILGTGWETEPVRVAQGARSGEVVACYSLTDGMCYVIVKVDGTYQGVLVQANRERGKVVWKAIRTDAQAAGQEELMDLVGQFVTVPNLTLDFDRLRGGPELEDVTGYLRSVLQDMTGKGPNDPAKSDLAAFVDGAAARLSTQTVEGRKNHLSLREEDMDRLAQLAQEVYGGLLEVLEENDVTLNKTLRPTVRALWSDVELEDACQIDLDKAAAWALDGCDLQLLLGDAKTYLGLTADDLDGLVRDLDGTLRVQFSQEGDRTYALRFLDEDGEVVEQLAYPVTVCLPAGSALDTIMASYAGGSDNWGGQYDAATGAISFETRYSGQYEILENNVPIDDIAGLSEESQNAIRFMVSKGYLGAPEGQFRPGDALNRYEFTEALVGMFFALDRRSTVAFPDVPTDSPYYPYVASAQAKGIVNGYADGTFSGQDPITREQVFALAARTLMEQKGYTQPRDFESYLISFQDRAAISDWAADLVALSVREGVAVRGDMLLPQTDITREQAAVILYRLFQLLYEVSPVALEVPGAAGSRLPLVLGVAGGVVAVGCVTGGVTALVLGKKRKKVPKA